MSSRECSTFAFGDSYHKKQVVDHQDQNVERRGRQLNIAMVCDFFYPRLGGVEMHIFSLAQCLVKRGHKVIIITHSVPGKDGGVEGSNKLGRTSVRYLPGPIKVYYCPFEIMVDGAILPTLTITYPLMRHIFIRERIDIVHGHQATSPMSNEALVYASMLQLSSVYTDHSLFGLGDDIASAVLNKVLQCTLSTVNACIAVSHTCRANLILRAHLHPHTVLAVPNAVDASKFEPPPLVNHPCDQKRTKTTINVVVLSRLVYRKGVDLLLHLIPKICDMFEEVHFIIGGDGAKKLPLEEMVERHQLQSRVEFLGAVASADVRSVLCRGDLFVNCSLTESFCIALLEAASTGLYVVSTDVGGVHEVLPHSEKDESKNFMSLAKPNAQALTDAVSQVLRNRIIPEVTQQSPDERLKAKWKRHRQIRQMYSWDIVASQTESIYYLIIETTPLTFWQRIERYYSAGPVVGTLACLIACMVYAWHIFISHWFPLEDIDTVPDLKAPFRPSRMKDRKGEITMIFHKEGGEDFSRG